MMTTEPEVVTADDTEAASEAAVDVTEVSGLLHAVQESALRLLAESPTQPSRVRVRVGEVTVELDWPTAEATHPGSLITPASPVPPVAMAASNGVASGPAASVDPALHLLCASTVGVFYRCPEPGARPFVSEGDQVRPGQQVGIIEAMKLMIPVEADRSGRIAQILVTDGEPVEYAEPLFALAAETPEAV